MFLIARRITLWPIECELGVRSAGMVGVASEVPAGRAIDSPAAVDFVEIAIAARLEDVGLLGREFAALVVDDEAAPLDRLGGEQAEPGAGAADTEGLLAGHTLEFTTIRAGTCALSIRSR